MLFIAALTVWAGPYERGIQALQDGHPGEARRALERAAALEPARPEVWWELGWACWAYGDYRAAARAWAKTLALDSQHPEAHHWLGAALARTRLRTASATPPPPVEEEPTPGVLRIAAAGDTMMGSDLRKGPAGLPPGDGTVLFEPVAPILQRADIAFLNLEGPLADGLPGTKCRPGSTDCHSFRTPTRYVEALRKAGIDVVSLANNHAMDLGVPGLESTMTTLDRAGIAHAGRYDDVALVDRNGVRIAFVAASSGSCCLDVNTPNEIAAAIREADAHADIVVLSFHGGAEGSRARHVPGTIEYAWGEARGDVRALARAAVDAGADLVLGHGPHVLRGMERYRGRLIVYSLGNFVGYRQFGTRGGYGGTSMILEIELAPNGVLRGGRVHPLILDAEGRPHPDPNGAAYRQVDELGRTDFPDTFVSVGEDGSLTW